MVADVQLYQGRSLDIVQQAESLGSYGAAIVNDYDRYTAAHDGRDRRPARAEATPQQYLLLVGGLRTLSPGNARGPLRARLVLLRAMSLSGWAPLSRTAPAAAHPDRTTGSSRSSAGRCAALRAGRLGAHPPRPGLSCALIAGSGRAWMPRRTRHGGGIRPRRRLRPVASGARHPLPVPRGEPALSPSPTRTATRCRIARSTGPASTRRIPEGSVPNHVAIVMDGNGRWANRRGLTRIEGHRAGEEVLLDVVAGAIQAGVKHLSVYAFSTENWRARPRRCASSWATTATCSTAAAISSTSGACASGGPVASRACGDPSSRSCSTPSSSPVATTRSRSRCASTTAAGTRSSTRCGRSASRSPRAG
jgi:hypothetical protein